MRELLEVLLGDLARIEARVGSELLRFWNILVEDEEEELSPFDDVDCERDFFRFGLFVLLHEDAKMNVVFGGLHPSDPLVAEDTGRFIGETQVPRLILPSSSSRIFVSTRDGRRGRVVLAEEAPN